MLQEVTMPKLGESLTQGTIVKWCKQVGEWVQKDEVLLEIATDKVDSEIPSPVAGRLAEILVLEQQTVPVNSVIARLEDQTLAIHSAPGADSARLASAEGDSLSHTSEKPFYSPAVRHLVNTQNIPLCVLEQIPGSGRQGRVTKQDILQYLDTHPIARGDDLQAHFNEPFTSSPKAETPVSAPLSAQKPGIVEPPQQEMLWQIDPLTRTMFAHMRESLDTAAHAYCTSECDVTRLMQAIHQEAPSFLAQEGFKLTVTPWILQALVRTLQEFPKLNSNVIEERWVKHQEINLGVAVATERGLLVPVVTHAEEKNRRGLARALHEVMERAHHKRLQPGDLQGATFTFTNFGVFGNLWGLPILHSPNVGILGMGAITKRPLVLETEAGDVLAIRSMVYLTLGFDHRVIDGATAGRFLQKLVERLEQGERQE